jgi:hypothetical protein
LKPKGQIGSPNTTGPIDEAIRAASVVSKKGNRQADHVDMAIDLDPDVGALSNRKPHRRVIEQYVDQ